MIIPIRRFDHCRVLAKALSVAGALVCSGALAAEPLYTQSIALQSGWNAIYLEVTPTNTAPEFLFQGLPLESAWAVQETLSSVDYIQDATEALWNVERWAFFVPTNRLESVGNRLFAILGHKPYLLKLTSAATWTVVGQPAVKVINWAPDAFNLRGFPLDPLAPPTFQTFFRPSPAHYNAATLQLQSTYRLSGAGVWTLVTPATQMKSGEAYWVYCKGGSDFQGPLNITGLTGEALEYSENLDTLTIGLNNSAPGPVVFTLRDLTASSQKPLAYYRFDSEIGATWPDLPTPLTFFALAGANLPLRLAIRRTAFAGTSYGTVLSVNNGAGTRFLLPVTAAKSALAAAASSNSPPQVQAQSHAGLWIGSVSITGVSEAHSGTLVTNGFDSQGRPLLIERVGFNPTPRPVGTPAELRLLVHVSSNGTARLLKEVIQLFKEGTYTNDANGNLTAATPGRYVLLTDPALVPQYKGVALRDGVGVGRRFSTVAYDFPGQSLALSGTFAANQSLRVTNTMSADWPTNPFRHRYHPDHQPRDSYDIKRDLTLQILPPPANAPPDYEDQRLVGTYQEIVTGLHKTNIIASGSISLVRVSRVGVLNQ